MYERIIIFIIAVHIALGPVSGKILSPLVILSKEKKMFAMVI